MQPLGIEPTPAAAVSTPEPPLERVSSGVEALDRVIDGGFPANRTMLVCGEPGTGKTIFALQYLTAGLKRGEPVVCVSVDQKPRHLLQEAACFDWQLDKFAADGQLTLLDASPYFTKVRNKSKGDMPIDVYQIAADLSQQISRTGARRLVIDSLSSLVPLDLTRGQAQDYLRSVVLSLEDNLNCNILVTCRMLPDDPLAVLETAQYLVSGVIELRVKHVYTMCTRYLFLKKMRATEISPQEFPFTIESHVGIEVTRS